MRRQSSRDSIERRMDQWVETGRQLVDGVAGNRPGQRRNESRVGFNDMGRWVGERIDWFFEDEEDWSEPIEPLIDLTETPPIRKRSLNAISLRVPKVLPESSQVSMDVENSEQWPDDASFKIERWDREVSQKNELGTVKTSSQSLSLEKPSKLRPLPRSSRRRN